MDQDMETDSSFEESSLTPLPDKIQETYPLPETQQTQSASDNNNNNVSTSEIVNQRRVISIEGPSSNRKVPSFPVNNTMSSNNSKVVLFKQINVEGENSVLSLDPIGIARTLEKVLSKDLISDVRINRRRNVIAVELDHENRDNIQKLLDITIIGKCKVEGYRPYIGTQEICHGVISPVTLDCEMEDLLTIVDSPIQIVKAVRLNKFSNGRKEESLAVKLEFIGTNLPEKIKLGYIAYQVKKYNMPPIRCYKCQRIGHMAKGCTAKQRCLVCSEEHSKNECQNQNRIKCANCGGNHVASSKTCVYNIKASKVDKLVKEGKTISEAKRLVDRDNSTSLPSNQTSGQLQTVERRESNRNRTYANAVVDNRGHDNRTEDTDRSSREELKGLVTETLNEFTSGMVLFVKELLSAVAKLSNEQLEPQLNDIVISAAKNHLNKNIAMMVANSCRNDEPEILALATEEEEQGVLSTDVEERSKSLNNTKRNSRKRKKSKDVAQQKQEIKIV